MLTSWSVPEKQTGATSDMIYLHWRKAKLWNGVLFYSAVITSLPRSFSNLLNLIHHTVIFTAISETTLKTPAVFHTVCSTHPCGFSCLQVSFPAPLWRRLPFPAPSLETDSTCALTTSTRHKREACPWREVRTFRKQISVSSEQRLKYESLFLWPAVIKQQEFYQNAHRPCFV